MDDVNANLVAQLNHIVEGSYGNPIKLDINGSFIQLEVSKPKVEALTDLLGKLLQFRESDLAKLSLIDREAEITGIIDSVISKLQNELMNY